MDCWSKYFVKNDRHPKMRMLRSSFKTNIFSELGMSGGYHLTKVINLIQKFSSAGEVASGALADVELPIELVAAILFY